MGSRSLSRHSFPTLACLGAELNPDLAKAYLAPGESRRG